MQIAVLIGGYRLFALSEDKIGGGLLARLQILLLETGGGLQHNEGDVVRFQHRVLHRADLHIDLVAFNGDYGNMLFSGGVGRVRHQLRHALYAAGEGVLHGEHIPARVAFIEFHGFSSFCFFVCCRFQFSIFREKREVFYRVCVPLIFYARVRVKCACKTTPEAI